ncbi:MAG: hypothetical protein PT944_06485 [Actinomycetaceae bacterium]|nr:hypothetical protein [Actinomycetaceae bacterium]
MLTAGLEQRTIEGLLLPYGEQGYTNKGRVSASRGRLKASKTSPVFLNVEHDQRHRIGRAVSLQERSDGIHATFHIAGTAAGDDALLEASEGLRASLSIEIDKPVIRAGKIVGGTITGAALVAQPAFPSAMLTASMPDEGELEQATDTADDIAQTLDDVIELLDDAADEANDIAHVTNPDTPTPTIDDDKETIPMKARRATQIGGLTAAALPKQSTHDKNWLIANLSGQTTDTHLYAALADVVPANVLGMEQPQYVGELWNGRAYERKIIPLFDHADLTSWKVQGWRWKTKPAVAPYQGNKKDIPSAAIATEAVEIAAQRIAGGHDIDRKFKDFPDAEFWDAYFAAMVESYARVSDTAVLTEVKKAATVITSGTKPTDIAQGIVNIVDGAISIMNETDTVPTGAVVAVDLWRDIMLTPQEHVLGYLSAAMSLEDGSLGAFPIIPSAALGKGETLVVAKPAVTVHELAGSPIRVEAIDVSKGGVDEAVFGYYAVNVHDKGGLALVNKAAEAEDSH